MLPSQISEFLAQKYVMSLAVTLADNRPYAASCFYAYEPASLDLIFVSDPATRHGQALQQNPRAAATIHHASRNIAEIRGIQLLGSVRRLEENSDTRLIELYRKSFPIPGDLEPVFWALRIDYLKMTDNRVSFGYKRIWQSQ